MKIPVGIKEVKAEHEIQVITMRKYQMVLYTFKNLKPSIVGPQEHVDIDSKIVNGK